MVEDLVRSDVEALMVMVVVVGDRVITTDLDLSTMLLSRDMIMRRRSHTHTTLPMP